LETVTCHAPQEAAAEVPWGVALAAAVVTVVPARVLAAVADPPACEEAREAAVADDGKEK